MPNTVRQFLLTFGLHKAYLYWMVKERRSVIEVPVPNVIRFGGFTYKQKFGGKTNWGLRGDNYSGTHCHLLQEIEIATDLGEEHMTNALAHEWSHAINKIYLAGALEETQIELFGNGLHQLFNELGIKFSINNQESAIER